MAEGATHSDRLLQGPDESMCGCAAAWNSVSACECVRVDEGEGLGWKGGVRKELQWVGLEASLGSV